MLLQCLSTRRDAYNAATKFELQSPLSMWEHIEISFRGNQIYRGVLPQKKRIDQLHWSHDYNRGLPKHHEYKNMDGSSKNERPLVNVWPYKFANMLTTKQSLSYIVRAWHWILRVRCKGEGACRQTPIFLLKSQKMGSMGIMSMSVFSVFLVECWKWMQSWVLR